MTIHYKIQFYSDWHCGSGLAAGADVDALVVKDSDGFPFVPGKTIKGLLREQLSYFKPSAPLSVDTMLGSFDGREEKHIGCLFFSNAVLSKNEREIIKAHNGQEFLYRGISSTAIDADGIARDFSLRRMEVCVPCELLGKITGIPEGEDKFIENGLKMIKRLGQNRNRGLGRCRFSVVSTEKEDVI